MQIVSNDRLSTLDCDPWHSSTAGSRGSHYISKGAGGGGREHAAIALCVRIYNQGKRARRFRLASAIFLRDLGKRDGTAIVQAATRLYLVKQVNAELQLTATGIYVAKRELANGDAAEQGRRTLERSSLDPGDG